MTHSTLKTSKLWIALVLSCLTAVLAAPLAHAGTVSANCTSVWGSTGSATSQGVEIFINNVYRCGTNITNNNGDFSCNISAWVGGGGTKQIDVYHWHWDPYYGEQELQYVGGAVVSGCP